MFSFKNMFVIAAALTLSPLFGNPAMASRPDPNGRDQECMYMGDSVALELFISTYNAEDRCTGLAKADVDGIDLIMQLEGRPRKISDYAVISIGNDKPINSYRTYYEAAVLIRRRVIGTWNEDPMVNGKFPVFWILPRNSQSSSEIRQVAEAYGDTIIDLSRYKSVDNVHPTAAGYRLIKKRIDDEICAMRD